MTEYFEFKANEKMEYRRYILISALFSVPDEDSSLLGSGFLAFVSQIFLWEDVRLTIGGTVKGDPVRDIIKCAWENGVNFIDTAEGIGCHSLMNKSSSTDYHELKGMPRDSQSAK
ncbi:4160_t:CDS:2, partial [Acaulospora colombiana]